jgi:hypothetical protein
MYATQLAVWADVVGRDNLMLLQFDAISDRPDALPDFDWTFHFFVDQGQPVAPFDLTLLNSDLSNLHVLLGQVPDGTVMRFDMTSPELGRAAVFEFTFLGALAQEFTGNGRREGPLAAPDDCSATFDFASMALAAFVPTGTFDIQCAFEADSITGTVTLNGSTIAVVRAGANGGATQVTFQVNLQTGAVTAAP